MVDKKEKADSKKTANKPKKSELPPEGSAEYKSLVLQGIIKAK
tara:strand:+ start:297 stop:425 length:129 start_codon:yes stop_codon:yes gene_type:complete